MVDFGVGCVLRRRVQRYGGIVESLKRRREQEKHRLGEGLGIEMDGGAVLVLVFVDFRHISPVNLSTPLPQQPK